MSRLPRKRPIDYILPFLIMICAGVIVVLAFQLYQSMNKTDDTNDIYMYMAKGNAKVLQWGSGEWEKAYNGTKILQGDSIKTQRGGRMVINLFNDHYLRMDQSSEIVFSEIKKNGDAYDINLILREGKVWINNDEASETPVKFMVKTDHTVVKTISTIYEVEQNESEEIVRVLKGSIVADIMVDEDGEKRNVETIQIGVGQEAVITADDLKAYTDRESPSVIDAIDDDFRETTFYKWNMSEDKNPTDFSIKTSTDSESDEFDFENDEEDSGDESDLAKPTIETPSTLNFDTNEDSLTIRGTTSAETKKMMVDVVSDGEENTYELNLYITGGTDWSFAISVDAGTLAGGVNTYEFYSISENDAESKKEMLTVSLGDVQPIDGEEEEEDEEELDLPPLTTPVVDSYNGGTSNEDDTGSVNIIGSVEGAEKVIVDGYTLSAFEPGDTSWSYNARESLGNLEEGENIYEVEAIAPDGTSKTTEFTIIYTPAEVEEEEEPVEEEPVEDDPATEDPAVE